MLKLIAVLSTYYSHFKFTWLFVYMGFVIHTQNLPWFPHLAKLWDGARSGTRWYGCCSGKNVAWLIMLWSQFWFRTWDVKWYWPFIVLAVICTGCKLDGSQIALAKLSAHGPAFWAGRAVREPHFAWAAKCAGMRGTPRARDATRVRGPRFKCAGRTECAGGNCAERWVGRTVHAFPSHLPCNAHAMQPRFHARGPRCAAIARHVKG